MRQRALVGLGPTARSTQPLLPFVSQASSPHSALYTHSLSLTLDCTDRLHTESTAGLCGDGKQMWHLRVEHESATTMQPASHNLYGDDAVETTQLSLSLSLNMNIIRNVEQEE